jgi:hypothetical protein
MWQFSKDELNRIRVCGSFSKDELNRIRGCGSFSIDELDEILEDVTVFPNN